MLVLFAGWFLAGAQARAEGGPQLTSYRPAKTPPGAETLCRQARHACAAPGPRASLSDEEEFALAARVNRTINGRMSPVRDPQGIGASWSPPTGDVGDCKHYAVAKKVALVRAGILPTRLLLAIVAAPADAELHAVLVYRTARGDLVLDNLTDAIQGWRETGYTFIKMQSPLSPARWDLVLEGPRARRT